MTQQEKDDISIFLMSQDARICHHAGRSNHFEHQLHKVMEILRNEELTASAKVLKLKDKLGMNATNTHSAELVEKLKAQLAAIEADDGSTADDYL
jgi:hypothetical protein